MDRVDNASHGVDRLVDRVAYQPALDGLRGLAALAVFAVHLEQNSVIEGSLGPISLRQFFINGRTGVAVFFLLTGYFLARPLWANPVEQRLSRTLGDFWKRRAAKLVPLYWLVLLSLGLLHRSWSNPDGRWDLLVHATFLQNTSAATLYSISEPLWAIAVIGQYYVFFWIVTALLGSLRCLSDQTLYFVFGGLMTIGWGLNGVLAASGVFDSPDSILVWQHSLPIHLPIFAMGAMVAAIDARRKPFSGKPQAAMPSQGSDDARHLPPVSEARCSPPTLFAERQARRVDTIWCWRWEIAAAVAALSLIFILGSPVVDAIQLRGSRYGYPVVPGLLAVILCAANGSGWTCRILSWRPVLALGLISYSVYLVHLPVMRLTQRVLSAIGHNFDSSAVLGIVSLSATCVVAWVLTAFVEFPLRRRVIRKQAGGQRT